MKVRVIEKKRKTLEKILAYINTQEIEQKKGGDGSVK